MRWREQLRRHGRTPRRHFQDGGEARLVVGAASSVAAMQLRDRRDEAQAKARRQASTGFPPAARSARVTRAAVRLGDSGAVVRDPRTSRCPSVADRDRHLRFARASSAYLTALSTRFASAWLISSRLRVHHRPARSPRACSFDPRLLRDRLVELEHIARDARTRRTSENSVLGRTRLGARDQQQRVERADQLIRLLDRRMQRLAVVGAPPCPAPAPARRGSASASAAS